MPNQETFERIATAKRGTMRLEHNEHVVLLHCSSYTTYERCQIDHTNYYANIYQNDTLIARTEFNSFLTYQQFVDWYTNIIK